MNNDMEREEMENRLFNKARVFLSFRVTQMAGEEWKQIIEGRGEKIVWEKHRGLLEVLQAKHLIEEEEKLLGKPVTDYLTTYSKEDYKALILAMKIISHQPDSSLVLPSERNEGQKYISPEVYRLYFQCLKNNIYAVIMADKNSSAKPEEYAL